MDVLLDPQQVGLYWEAVSSLEGVSPMVGHKRAADGDLSEARGKRQKVAHEEALDNTTTPLDSPHAQPSSFAATFTATFDNVPRLSPAASPICTFGATPTTPVSPIPLRMSPCASEHDDDESDEGTRPQHPHVCTWPGCKRSFRKPARLTRHMLAHTGERPYACRYCDSSFTRKDHLKRHELAAHSSQGSPRPHACSHNACGMAFDTLQHLRRHEAVHKRQHACNFEGCARTFHKHSQLQRHMCIHTGEKPYPCPEPHCSASFQYPSQLKKHIASHEKGTVSADGSKMDGVPAERGRERMRVECSVCGKVMSRAHLRTHVKLHSDDPHMFVCQRQVEGSSGDTCGLSFSSRSNLNQHELVVHDGVQPFACGKCGKFFGYKSSASRHERLCGTVREKRPRVQSRRKPAGADERSEAEQQQFEEAFDLRVSMGLSRSMEVPPAPVSGVVSDASVLIPTEARE